MQAAWSEGYYSQCPYSIGYYREQSPTFQQFCLLLQGYDVPEGENFCELGFGQGLTVNIHAAAVPGNWFGTDFTPEQVTFARSMAQASGSNAKLYDEAFADFCHRTDLPEFDYISLHGIWSWVTEENRAHMRHLLNKRLRNGGVAYVSYNALPGSMARAPVRSLMQFHDKFIGNRNGPERAVEALQFVRQVVEAKPAFLGMQPGTEQTINHLQTTNPTYLAHEYLNDIWENMHLVDVADYLSHARLTFAGSALPHENVDSLGYTPEVLAFLATVESPLLREQLRDYFSNNSFRRDLYLRGGLKLDTQTQSEKLLNTRIMLCAPPDIVNYNVEVGMGTVNLTKESHEPIIEMLATDNYRPRTLRELCATVPTIRPGQVMAAVATLCGTGFLAPCQSEERTSQAAPQTRKLNEFLLQQAKRQINVEFLASPLLGAGMSVPRLHVLFMAFDNTPDPVSSVVALLRQLDEKILEDGREVDDPNEERKVLESAYTEYTRRKPIYTALMLR